MNAPEKLLYYASLVVLIGAMALRLLHLLRPENVISALVLGILLFGIANERYQRRLRRQHEMLKAELHKLSSPC